MTLVLRYAARSDRGLVRANNEDSVYAGARLLALADGMGGHAAGEVASQLVIAALAHLDDDEPGGDLLAQARHARSATATRRSPHRSRWSPTSRAWAPRSPQSCSPATDLGWCTSATRAATCCATASSTQITKDDTFVQTLVDEGRITAEEAHSHPQRSLIMRALTGHEVEPTLIMREARAGDRYLLCSDGLSDPVSDETILEALQIPDVAESADRLIELALRGGGPDNVTVVVADVVDYDYGQTQPILAGAVSGEDDQLTAPPNTAAGRASAINPRRNEAAKRVPAAGRNRRRASPGGRGGGCAIVATLVVLLVLAGLAIGRRVIRSNYYVAEYDGMVSIMRGRPGIAAGHVRCSEPYLSAASTPATSCPLISYRQSARSAGLPHDAGCRICAPPNARRCRPGLPAGTLDDADRADARTRAQLATAAVPATARHRPPTTDRRRPQRASPARRSARRQPRSSAPRARTEPRQPRARNSTPAATAPGSRPRATPPPRRLHTVTALPPPPPQPGIDCRAAA